MNSKIVLQVPLSFFCMTFRAIILSMHCFKNGMVKYFVSLLSCLIDLTFLKFIITDLMLLKIAYSELEQFKISKMSYYDFSITQMLSAN